ncbi:asparagine synthase (glutamine-hydrolyzing) [Hyphomicrobium sp.]|jgi:asparagine synthase (glutamine-hydrolysing)|uniref:asparagine synthase (glutamine-hydrolyzing) n=1 Tax=Hyphomicrobium sp. TaxID=82 RepID=UPI002B83C413|nr:asparagine synthase (glutamine-hydrolyzing) [Hyphomicrobium sp.]HVZ05420.1 asparagine synthase (glutamine-hydrolyzing) [Hyphomicrobium sp.]
MCGIFGIIDLKGRRSVPASVLKRAADAMHHRGPDEEGYLQRPGFGFASRRLSIVGLADGQQPMFNEDKSVSVVFNGEIYDQNDWRYDLKTRGHKLTTHCDTEILPHMWEEYGQDMFAKLNGQFAFALFDERQQTFVLARDRFGICPLYWTRTTRFGTDWLIFGSEIKTLLATGLVEARPDRRGIDAVFNFLAVAGPFSCFEGINILPPGNFLTITRGRAGESAKISERSYWTMDFPDKGNEIGGQDEKTLVNEFESVLYAAVQRRLRADVPVASYLSGGVDSSTVVAMARDILGAAPATFTVKIRDPKLDETEQAAVISRHLNANPHVVPCGSEEIVSNYQRLLVATEAPVTDTSCTALMLLAGKVHNEGFKVALTGEGSDEWLAGYPWYKINRVFEGLGAISGGTLDVALRRRAFTWLGCSKDGVAYLDGCVPSAGGPHAFQRFYDLLGASRFRFYSASMLSDLSGHDPYADFAPDLGRAQKWHPVNRAIYWAGRIHLPGQLLSLKGDRIAMSQSVEMRYPFLDNNVFDFLANIDPNWKLKGFKEKYLLRRVAERWLPKSVAWRPKGMFRAPLDGFFLDQRLPYVDELLSEESLKKTGYFDPKAVQIWRTKYRELTTRFYRRSSVELGLVAVLATQLWHQTFVDSSLASLPDWRSLSGVAGDVRDLGFAEEMPASAAAG